MIREEIAAAIRMMGQEDIDNHVFHNLYLPRQKKLAFLSSLCSGHHILVLGPPGCGKTTLANRVSTLLSPIEVVDGCPLNCSLSTPSCPWCTWTINRGGTLKKRTLSGEDRIKKVQGSAGLAPQDLIGDVDPEMVITQGIHSLAAFVPGKLLRANRGILLIDFFDRVSERVLDVILSAVQDGTVTIGAYDEKLTLDLLVLAVGNEQALTSLPADLLDIFDIISLDYQSSEIERKVVSGCISKENRDIVDEAVDIVVHTRDHADVKRGASTRGTIKYAELLTSLSQLGNTDKRELMHTGASIALPHRIELTINADNPRKRDQIIDEIADDVLGTTQKEEALLSLSRDDILSLAEEIARTDGYREPLKYGAFELLLKRVHRFPESMLANLHQDMMHKLIELYPERYGKDSLTDELLRDIEASRKTEEEIKQARADLEAQALQETLKLLEQKKILERNATGLELSQSGITFLLETLLPKSWDTKHPGSGKHNTGRKLAVGEGKVVGLRHFHFGDRYQDISIRDTMREAIRNRRQNLTKEDMMVAVKDIRAKMDIVLAVDLSGTMQQLEKLWYAKQSCIALSLAASRFQDRVAIVSFSNLADTTANLTSNPYTLTRKVLELQLHRNAFTNIGYGLLKACQLLQRRHAVSSNRHIILISDGCATAPHPSPQKYALRQAARAAAHGITISCICINQESADPELMSKIARIGKGRSYLVGHEHLAETILGERSVAAA